MREHNPLRSRHSASPDTPPAKNVPALEYIFHPKSIALVGAATDPVHWWINEYYIDPLVKFGYTGKVYAVNPKGGEAKGMRIYRTLAEIDGPIDHVVSAIPARNCPDLVQECRDREVKLVQFFSAG